MSLASLSLIVKRVLASTVRYMKKQPFQKWCAWREWVRLWLLSRRRGGMGGRGRLGLGVRRAPQ